MIKRVLIIDDDPDTLDVLKEALGFEGYDVVTLERTADIFISLDLYKPDLLLVDYILDGINGGELCHRVKNFAETKYLPVIIMSAHSKVFTSLGRYDCNEFIAKPFDLYELMQSITDQIENAQQLKFSLNKYA